jgi:hypothetical protein
MRTISLSATELCATRVWSAAGTAEQLSQCIVEGAFGPSTDSSSHHPASSDVKIRLGPLLRPAPVGGDSDDATGISSWARSTTAAGQAVSCRSYRSRATGWGIEACHRVWFGREQRFPLVCAQHDCLKEAFGPVPSDDRTVAIEKTGTSASSAIY